MNARTENLKGEDSPPCVLDTGNPCRNDGVKGKPKPLRNALIGKIKAKAKLAGIEQGSEDYRQWLVNLGGKPSCGDMDEAELSAVLDRLDGKSPKPRLLLPVASDKVTGQIPTAQQWKYLHGLALDAGWSGLHGGRMVKHILHTAKVDALEDCNRKQVSDCIQGMERRTNPKKQAIRLLVK